MTSKQRRKYLALCMTMDRAWLSACAGSPSPSMRPEHILLVRVAARRVAS
jgi:hypothetical protein